MNIKPVQADLQKTYGKRIIDLGEARKDKRLPVSGDSLYVEKLDGTLYIKLNDPGNDSIDLSNVRYLKSPTPFNELYLTNEAQSGKQAILLIGREGLFNPAPTPDGSLLLLSDKTLVTTTRFQKRILDGDGFSISHRFESIAAGSSINVLIANPSGSGKQIYLIQVNVISLAQAWVNVYLNASYTGGTDLTPYNLNTCSSKTSSSTLKYNVTISGSPTPYKTSVCPGGTSVRAVGDAVEVGETMILGEGCSLIFEVINKDTTQSTDFSIGIIWWEEEE